jgi:O-acetyl-ADP-ribose deacetylase (regulator of RNase III)
VATGAGALPARFVFHAVGPIWHGGAQGERDVLRGAYQACLDLCDLNRCRSLALPAISTGVYGYPMEEAAEVALTAVAAHLAGRTQLDRVVFVLFDRPAFDTFAATLTRLAERRKLPPPE